MEKMGAVSSTQGARVWFHSSQVYLLICPCVDPCVASCHTSPISLGMEVALLTCGVGSALFLTLPLRCRHGLYQLLNGCTGHLSESRNEGQILSQGSHLAGDSSPQSWFVNRQQEFIYFSS